MDICIRACYQELVEILTKKARSARKQFFLPSIESAWLNIEFLANHRNRLFVHQVPLQCFRDVYVVAYSFDSPLVFTIILPKKSPFPVNSRQEARKALTNCFTRDHCFLIRELMDQYEDLKRKIITVENALAEKARPYAHLVTKLMEIPGISDILAMGILAEATADMSHFADERKFAAWAGVAAGNNESGVKKKDPSAAKAMCIRRTLSFGPTIGFLTGLGAATADCLYGSIAG